MTRDEHREKCIEALDAALEKWLSGKLTAEFILDSLHGIARVVPTEATNEMIDAGEGWMTWPELCRAMSAAGDLTNPPEGKP